MSALCQPIAASARNVYKPHHRTIVPHDSRLRTPIINMSAYNASIFVAGSTSISPSSSSSSTSTLGSFDSGEAAAWLKEACSMFPSPPALARPVCAGESRWGREDVSAGVAPSSRYGGLQRSSAIGRKRGKEIARQWSESRGVVYV